MSRPKQSPPVNEKSYELVDFLHLESKVCAMKGDTHMMTTHPFPYLLLLGRGAGD